jgi:hypothetical protein
LYLVETLAIFRELNYLKNMIITIDDLLGARGFIDSNIGSITLWFDDFVDANGNKIQKGSYPYNSVYGAEQFLATYFAYLNYRCKQQLITLPVTTATNVTPTSTPPIIQLPLNTYNGQEIPDPSQAFVAQPNVIADGVQFEKRGDVVQVRYDFAFSIYLENTFVYDVDKVVL